MPKFIARRPKTSHAVIVSLSLAEEMAAAVDADVDHRDSLVAAALAVGEWLTQRGHPGCWDLVDAGGVLQMLALTDPRESDGFLVTLTGLIGFAAFQEQLPVGDARRILHQIEGLTENAAVRNFAAQTASALREALAASA